MRQSKDFKCHQRNFANVHLLLIGWFIRNLALFYMTQQEVDTGNKNQAEKVTCKRHIDFLRRLRYYSPFQEAEPLRPLLIVN